MVEKINFYLIWKDMLTKGKLTYSLAYDRSNYQTKWLISGDYKLYTT